MLSSVKLFPALIGVCVIALGLKLSALITDVELLDSPAVAQEAKDDKKPNTPAKQGDKKETNSGSNPKKNTVNDKELDDILENDELSTTEEDMILQRLRARSQSIDTREQALELKEQLLAAVEKDIDTKIKKLEMIRADIRVDLGAFDKRQKEKMTKLVTMYESMKSKNAATIFSSLSQSPNKADRDVLLKVAARMKAKKVSDILAAMTPQDASKLTLRLATFAKPIVEGVNDK